MNGTTTHSAAPGTQRFIRGIDHVAINVSDLEAALTFYTTVLGLSITEREPSKPGIEYFLDCGPSLIGLIQAKREAPSHLLQDEGLGGNHVSFRVHADDFDRFLAYLKEHGVHVRYAKKRARSWSLYFEDLDGNKLEATAWPLEDGHPPGSWVPSQYDPATEEWRPL